MYSFKRAKHLNELKVFILVLALLLGNGFTAVSAHTGDADAINGQDVQPSDIVNHWARDQILEWNVKGLVAGYDDGTFRPERGVTRAEFITFVNRVYGLTQRAQTTFSDVSSGDWFSGEIAKAVAAGYISGYSDGTMRPNTGISRQEAAVILHKLLRLGNLRDERWVKAFEDADSIASWSRADINAVVAGGYMSGYPDGTFKPERTITRAETVALLSKAVGRLYNAPGTYGPDVDGETIAGNVTVNTADVILQNLVIDGDLYLAAGISDGDFEANNVVVKGRTVISGGGENSVVFNNTLLEEVIVYIVDGKVRVVAKGNTDIAAVMMESGGHLQEEGLTGKGFKNVQVLALKPGESIELEGNFDRVSIEAAVNLSVTGNTRIKELEVAGEAEGTNISTEKDTVIENLTLNSGTEVTGQGSIRNANVNTNDYSFEKEPDKVVKDGEEEEEKETGSGGSSGGGGGGSTPTVSLSAVSDISIQVNGTKEIALTTNATTVTAASGDTNIAAVEVKPDGKTLAVTGVNEGTATITVTGSRSGYRTKTITFDVTVAAETAPHYHEYGIKIVDAQSYTAHAPLNSPTNDDFAGIEPAKVSIEVTQEIDKAYDGSVRIAPVGADGIQLWAKDSAGNWYDINQVGWGPAGGFPIDLEAVTDVYLVAPAGMHTFTIKLIDITGNYGAVDGVIAEKQVAVEVTEPVPSIPSGTTTSFDQSEYSVTAGDTLTVISTTAFPDMSSVDDSILEDGLITLSQALSASNVVLHGYYGANKAVDIGTYTLQAGSTSFWVSDFSGVTDRQPLKNQVGSTDIFTIELAVPSDAAGKTITVTVKAVAATEENFDNPANWTAVLATATADVTVTAPLPAQSTYTLTYAGLADSYTAGILVSGGTQTEVNTAVEAAISGLTPIQVTLATDVVGQGGYEAVRILPVGAGEHIQLWAKDTNNNWYDINVTGWGPGTGFPLPAEYSATTDVYLLADDPGDYPLTIQLVDLNDGNRVIAQVTGTVSVVAEPIVLDSTITQDPGNTGGDNATVAVDGKSITFGGEIAYYEAAGGFPPVAGNYVGVEVTAPTSITPGAATQLIIGDTTYTGWDTFKDGDNFFWYYPRVTAAGQEFTFVVKWDGTETTADTFTIKIASDATLEGPKITSLTVSAEDITVTQGDQFSWPVNTQGTVAEADHSDMVRFYAVIPGLAADDIELHAIDGGTPAIVTYATERGYAGAETNDLVLAWGPATGFPLGTYAGGEADDYDHEDGRTTAFSATINAVGEFNVRFVFYNITAGKQINGVQDSATIIVEGTDTTPPVLEGVIPERGQVTLAHDETFKLAVDAYDEGGLYELEIDHSMEATLPEFSVYADADNPYGDSAAEFAAAGVTVTYDAAEQKWIIDFGNTVTDLIVGNGGITFYIVIKDLAGNQFGTMYGTTPENTFAYTVARESAPVASTYKFSYEIPQEITENEEVQIDVTFSTDTEGDFGYEDVRFAFKAEGPEDSIVTFKATDSNNVEHTFTNEGYWGPASGFDLPASYTAITNWTLIFSEAGNYSITFSLIDANTEEVIADITNTVAIEVLTEKLGQ